MKLVIISDTPMYGGDSDSNIKVFEPTLREIESIAPEFKTVTWFGYARGKSNPGHARCARASNIHPRLFPTVVGGKSKWIKFRIIPVLPVLLWITVREIRRHDAIHTRGPSVPAFICIGLSWLFKKKIFWHKYAGNWMEASPPFMYGLQKRMLIKSTHSRVTINGRWPRQQSHIFSFENPSFTLSEWSEAGDYARMKTFDGSLVLCFAGLIAEAKGVPALISALLDFADLDKFVQRVIIAGDGPALVQTKLAASSLPVQVDFTGYVDRNRLNDIYKVSHVLILPSRTEGFPKVVAEASSYGCIPVVTNVSSIGQYVLDGKTGFLLEDNQPSTIQKVLQAVFSHPDLKNISNGAVEMSAKFTYERFGSRVKELISKPVPLLYGDSQRKRL